MFDFFVFVFGAFSCVDIGDVDDGLLICIQHAKDFVGVAAAVEVVADVELLEIFVAAELFVVGVGDCIELGFILWEEYGLRIATEVRTRHGNHVYFVSLD